MTVDDMREQRAHSSASRQVPAGQQKPSEERACLISDQGFTDKRRLDVSDSADRRVWLRWK